MLWECFNVSRIQILIKVEVISKKRGHVKILKENINQSATKLALGYHFVSQHDNAPKQMLLFVQKTKVDVNDGVIQALI